MPRPTDDALLTAVAAALPTQRWFPSKGQPVTFRLLGRVPLPPAPDGVHVAHLLVAVDAADPGNPSVDSPVLQVPVTVREVALPGVPVLGVVDGLTVHDGPHDPAYVAALLAGIAADVPDPAGAGATGAGATGAGATSADATGAAQDGLARAGHQAVLGHVLGHLPQQGCSTRVLSGEQSNTSMILDLDGPAPAMLKLFRVLAPGENPDVEVTSALTGAGSPDVPAVLGWLEAAWSGAPTAGEHRGHLAVLTRFVTGGRDAWAAAVDAARVGTSFEAEAGRIGAATGRVHAALAQTLGTTTCEPPLLAATVAGLQQRVDWALGQAPALDELISALLAHRERLAELTAQQVGQLQRLHGDLHLGQVLLDGQDRVAILDFEGEPLRPLALRSVPGPPWQDVVGMLRSFDYAAAVADGPDAGWAEAAQRAFLAGYADATGVAVPWWRDSPLMTALWLDKALYEVVYETGNRPDWVPVPLRAVRAALSDA